MQLLKFGIRSRFGIDADDCTPLAIQTAKCVQNAGVVGVVDREGDEAAVGNTLAPLKGEEVVQVGFLWAVWV